MFIVDNNKKVPLYEQLYNQMRSAIVSGEWETDRKLEPIRILADRLGVSRNTVNRAYQQLLMEGYVRAIQGSGYYVEPLSPVWQQQELPGSKNKRKIKKTCRTKYDFSYDKFDSDAFPWSKWRHYLSQAITENSYSETIAYEDCKGSQALRESICGYIRETRGVICSPEQIVLCPGTQYGMEMVMNILPGENYKVAFEEPGYDGMRQVFLNHRCRLEPIRMTEQGLDVNQLEKTDCDLLYTCPSHQFPLGVTVPLAKRIQILQWCHRKDIYVIENDYDNEFLNGESMIPPMQALDKHEHVIYISTLTKILSPEVRCAFIVLPKALVRSFDRQYSHYYSFFTAFEQRALTAFINDGNLERQMRRMQIFNRRKRDVMLEIMKERLPGLAECSENYAGGSHMIVRIKSVLTQEELLSLLEEQGIRIYGTEQYWMDPAKADARMYLVGFNSIPIDKIEQAANALVQALKEIL